VTQRIRDAQVAEEIAAQAGTEGTPDLHLSDFLQPVIFGPQRPPLASSGYLPGSIGLSSAAVALNFSHAGLFIEGTNTNTVARVNSIRVFNETATRLGFTIRRLDDASGFTIAAAIPGYISAGNPESGGVFTAVRSNLTTLSGVTIAEVVVEPNTNELFDGPWIINNGALVCAPTIVNRAMRVYMSYEAWPAIRQQPIPG